MVVAWVEIGRLSDIPPLGARVVQTRKGPIAVFRAEHDQLYALDDKCPHLGGPLSNGIVFGAQVACPLHNWSIELETGIAAAPDEGCTLSYPVKLENNVVFLCLDADRSMKAAAQ